MAEAAVRRSPAAEFVRGLSADLTLKEMLEAVKAAGHDIGHARVYQIRAQEKLGFKPGVPGTRHRPKKYKKKHKPVAAVKVTAREAIEAIPQQRPNSAKTQVRKLAFQIGIDRLEELIRELKRELGL